MVFVTRSLPSQEGKGRERVTKTANDLDRLRIRLLIMEPKKFYTDQFVSVTRKRVISLLHSYEQSITTQITPPPPIALKNSGRSRGGTWGAWPTYLGWKKKQKEERLAGQIKQNWPPSLAQGQDPPLKKTRESSVG